MPSTAPVAISVRLIKLWLSSTRLTISWRKASYSERLKLSGSMAVLSSMTVTNESALSRRSAHASSFGGMSPQYVGRGCSCIGRIPASWCRGAGVRAWPEAPAGWGSTRAVAARPTDAILPPPEAGRQADTYAGAGMLPTPATPTVSRLDTSRRTPGSGPKEVSMLNHRMPRSGGWLPAIAPRRPGFGQTPDEAQRPVLTGLASHAARKQHASPGPAVQRARVVVAVLMASSLTLPGCWWDPSKPPDRNPDGTYNVSNHEVTTQEAFSAGSAVHVQASGSVSFGGAVGPFGGLGAPTLTADGDS